MFCVVLQIIKTHEKELLLRILILKQIIKNPSRLPDEAADGREAMHF
jgi:hypothetical protein